ncbi:hypothetical protein [Thermofilum sp.]|uniref:hypothetical protein n=1 Tax=Thermofilum sp. TaxID=1961369 RepID=UPI00316F5469
MQILQDNVELILREFECQDYAVFLTRGKGEEPYTEFQVLYPREDLEFMFKVERVPVKSFMARFLQRFSKYMEVDLGCWGKITVYKRIR